MISVQALKSAPLNRQRRRRHRAMGLILQDGLILQNTEARAYFKRRQELSHLSHLTPSRTTGNGTASLLEVNGFEDLEPRHALPSSGLLSCLPTPGCCALAAGEGVGGEGKCTPMIPLALLHQALARRAEVRERSLLWSLA